MIADNKERAKLLELRSGEVLDDLDTDEVVELARLAKLHPDVDRASFDQTVAALTIAAGRGGEVMPESLRVRLASDAERYLGRAQLVREPAEPTQFMPKVPPQRARSADRRAPRPSLGPAVGWLAAACFALLSVFLWLGRDGEGERDAPDLVAQGDNTTSASEARATRTPAQPGPRPRTSDGGGTGAGQTTDASIEELGGLTSQRNALRRSWVAGNDPAGRLVTGEVVWDGVAQRGFVRLKGLRKNDPAIEQYQLWVFDAARDERYPVDGGVFDMPASDDAVLIPIRTRLDVRAPTLFAVTLERAGGVVVSDRSRIVVLARI